MPVRRMLMSNSADEVMDLIFGRWPSQILHVGAELGIFDHLDKAKPKKADVLAVEMGVDPNHLYRLRAQSAIGLLDEDSS